MPTFNEVRGQNRSNILKVLELAIFARPWSATSTPVTSIWNATGLVIPTGFQPLGLTTKSDGVTWSREQDKSETMSYGHSQPTRIDITSDVSGLNFTMQESKRLTMEMYHGLSLSGVTTDANGNFYFDKPSRPAQPRWEILALGKDGAGPDAKYVVRILPEAQVTEMTEQTWTEDTEVLYPATLTGFVHEGWGTSFREIWGGPGIDHTAMGFPAPAGA